MFDAGKKEKRKEKREEEKKKKIDTTSKEDTGDAQSLDYKQLENKNVNFFFFWCRTCQETCVAFANGIKYKTCIFESAKLLL